MLLYAWLAYFNFDNARKDGLPVETAALAIPSLGPVLMVLSQASTLIELLWYRSYAAFSKPEEVVVVEQGRISQAIDACLFAIMLAGAILTWPGLNGWHRLYDNPLWNLAFFALGAFGLLTLFSTPRFRMVLSAQGIDDSQVRPSQLPWRDIMDVRLQKIWDSATITLRLRDESTVRSASLFWRWKRTAAIMIIPTKLGIDPDRLYEAIEMRRMAAAF
jgi:hypothetical protein